MRGISCIKKAKKKHTDIKRKKKKIILQVPAGVLMTMGVNLLDHIGRSFNSPQLLYIHTYMQCKLSFFSKYIYIRIYMGIYIYNIWLNSFVWDPQSGEGTMGKGSITNTIVLLYPLVTRIWNINASNVFKGVFTCIFNLYMYI